ncbi:hypothetical protein Q3G72_023655 [Acer saccharum]|nr:hypothetical protein Q3G72_023655 [Acer saccharum]
MAPVDFKWLTELLSLKLNSSEEILEKLPDVERHDSLSWNGACKVSSLALVDDERAVGDGDNCDQIKSKDKKGSKGVGELCSSEKGIRSRCSGRRVVNGCHSKIFLEMAAKEEHFQWASDMGSNSLSSIIESSQGEFSNFELLRGESCIRKDYNGLNFSKHVGVGLVSSNNIVRGLTNMGSDPGMLEGPLRGFSKDLSDVVVGNKIGFGKRKGMMVFRLFNLRKESWVVPKLLMKDPFLALKKVVMFKFSLKVELTRIRAAEVEYVGNINIVLVNGICIASDFVDDVI